MLREKFADQLKEAMKSGEKLRVSTLRLIQSGLKDKDIEARGAGKPPLADEDILVMLQKMVRQRQESAAIYEKAGRKDLAEAENAEIGIISAFLPQQMDEEEARDAIRAIITESGAASIRDMGKVMALVKQRYSGRIDTSTASSWVKQALGG